MERAADEASRRLGALQLRFHTAEDSDTATAAHAAPRAAVRRPYFLDRRPFGDQPGSSEEDE